MGDLFDKIEPGAVKRLDLDGQEAQRSTP
jgi:hypothetical protein